MPSGLSECAVNDSCDMSEPASPAVSQERSAASALSSQVTQVATLFACSLLVGSLLGALTNLVNGHVSPEYFVTVLGWHEVQDVPRAAVAQGIFEGAALGVVPAGVFTTVIAIVSRGVKPLRSALPYLMAIALVAFVGWVLGGLAAMALASFSAEFYRHAFIGVPEERGAMLRYAWVGGSIWGIEIGGVLATIAVSVIYRNAERRAIPLG